MKRMITMVGMVLMSSTAFAWQATVINNPEYSGEVLEKIALEQQERETVVVPAKFEAHSPAGTQVAKMEGNWALRYFQDF
jgi:hypothetical protein